MRTIMAKKETVERNWFVIDATNHLGRAKAHSQEASGRRLGA